MSNRKRIPTVAVTGLEGRDNPYPGVALARALRLARQKNVRIIGLGYDPVLTGAYRRDLFDAVYLSPLPSDPASTQLARLERIHAEDPIDLLIPALDSEIPVYAAHHEDLARLGIRAILPPLASIQLRLKSRLEGFARRHGFTSPRTETVTDPAAHWKSSAFGFPCFLKGHLADAIRVTNVDEAVAAFWRLVARWGYPILAQEPVLGDEVDVCAVMRRGGDPIAMVAMKKVVISSMGKAIAGVIFDEPAVLKEAAAMVKALAWEGPLELELVREIGTGKLSIIEINARFPAWVAATHGAGCNLPDILLKYALGEPMGSIPTPKAGTLFARTSRTTIGRIEDFAQLAATGCLKMEAP